MFHQKKPSIWGYPPMEIPIWFPLIPQEKVPSHVILGRVAGEDPPASVVSWANMVILFWLGYSLDISIYLSIYLSIYIYIYMWTWYNENHCVFAPPILHTLWEILVFRSASYRWLFGTSWHNWFQPHLPSDHPARPKEELRCFGVDVVGLASAGTPGQLWSTFAGENSPVIKGGIEKHPLCIYIIYIYIIYI